MISHQFIIFLTRCRQLVIIYLDGNLILSNNAQCSGIDMRLFAVIAPEAAVAGTPIPGNV